ncbi:ABC transporter [Fusarium austroafricanum]|uniref:ABC transporter n=1 Tax=Fusarium austroafricanum TaxID=2364996 RepID=A0A8H4KKP8_9HYPO|nr:ABC transporter [Fusarium austroafricanum]
MRGIHTVLEVSQAVAAVAIGLCVLAAQFEPAERCWRKLNLYAYLLSANLILCVVNLLIEFVYAGGMPDARRLFAHIVYTLSVAIETSHVCPATAREKKTQRLGRWAYLLSWVFMAIFDVLAIIDSSLSQHSSLFVYKLSAPVLRVTHVVFLFPVYAYPDHGEYFKVGDATPTEDVEHNAGAEEQLPKPAIMDQSIEDEIHAAGGYWSWMKKFRVLRSWVWPRDMPWKWKKLLALSAILLRIVEVLCSLGGPLLYSIFIDNLVKEAQNTGFLIGMWALYAIVYWLSKSRGLGCWRQLCWKRFELDRDSRVKNTTFSHLMEQDADFHHANNSIDINTAVAMGTDVCKCFDLIIYESLPQLVDLIVASGIILWRLGSQIWLLQSFSIALDIIITLRAKRGSVPIFDQHIIAVLKTRFVQQSALQAWTSIASQGQIGHEIERHSEAVRTENSAVSESWWYALSWNFGLGALSTATSIGNVTFLILSNKGKVEILKDTLLFLLYRKHLDDPIDFFSRAFQDIFDSFVSAARLRRLVEMMPKMQNGTRGLAGVGIRFIKVSFGYEPAKLVFKDLDLDFEPRKTTAIVGPSGAGKTTLGRLVLRFYDPTEGNVERNGQDLKSIIKKELLEHTAYMEQSPHLFNMSVYDNIRLDCKEISEEEVQEACKKAGIHDEIMRLQGQYNTILGERGNTLSGGQKQRIAFARSLVHRGDLVVLDEPTSNQDVGSEEIIKQAIKELSKTKTVIVIAQVPSSSPPKLTYFDSLARHRLSTIRRADRIIVLRVSEEGHTEIAEAGTHDELLKLEGQYFQMWNTFIGED